MSDVTIPEDVMRSAEAIVRDIVDKATGRDGHFVELPAEQIIARAILAERERAANIAEAVEQECREFSDNAPRRQQKMASSAQAFVAKRIAQAIRSSHD